MQLTTSQQEQFATAQSALESGQPVLITGKSNGKTRLIHVALETLAQKVTRSSNGANVPEGLYLGRVRHSENKRIEFMTRAYLPTNNITVPGMMKQVLAAHGELVPHGIPGAVKRFDEMVRSLADNGRMIALAIDNTELLSPKAFTVLKALNEYYDPARQRSVGVGLMLAATPKAMKRMPMSFLLRCAELRIGRVTNEEIAELIDALFPAKRHLFTPRAMQHLAKCETNLELRHVIERSIAEQSRYRLKEIDFDVVEEKIAATSYAKAA